MVNKLGAAESHVHMIGIGGYGMSAIARVLLDLGYQVSGSDEAEQESTRRLRERGATVFIGHRAPQVAGADMVVYSTAVGQDNVEIVEARAQGIPVMHRSEMLARFVDERQGIAVSGAHGKTTTTSMIAFVMEACNLDPTYVVGGVVANLGDSAKAGRGPYVVAEADESDASFLHYHPTIAVVTNIEPDHLEHYDADYEKLKSAYVQFARQIKPGGCCIACIDDSDVRGLLEQIDVRLITYGLDQAADVTAIDVELLDRGSRSRIVRSGTELGWLQLSVPGRHNIANALAALVVCMEAGIPFADAADALKQFSGAKRRFQVVGDVNDILVVDDYAHHPTEIAATLASCLASGRRIVAVFQPQRYSRTYYLLDEFSRSFADADEVLIADIYAPVGEKPIEGVNASRLVELIRENSNERVTYTPTLEDVFEYLVDTVKPGDLVLTMGAGDIWKVAHRLASALQKSSETM